MTLKIDWPKTLLVLFILGFVLLSVAPAKAADTPYGLSISPFLQEVKIDNDSPTFKLHLTNNTDQSYNLSLSAVDFSALDNTGAVAFFDSSLEQLLDKYTLAKWLTITPDNLTLEPNQSASVTAQINNDGTLGPGGHYGAIVANKIENNNSDTNTVNLQPKLTSLVIATKLGGEKYDLSLTKLSHNGNLFKLPDEIYLTLKATGNVHVVPRGIVYLKDNTSRTISRGIINPESGYVLPASDRLYKVKLDKLASKPFWSSSFKIQVDYRYDGIETYASKSVDLHLINYWWPIILVFMGVVLWFCWPRYIWPVLKRLKKFILRHKN